MRGDLRSVLKGTGCCLPERIVSNAEFATQVDTSDEWIRSRTGIRERRFVAGNSTSASLAVEAARRALAQAELSPQQLDLILCATVTPDWMTPSNACLIQTALGCRTIPAFDITAACTGFLYGFATADAFIRSGMAQTVLVVGTEVLSRALDFEDRNSCILFGDGAGAAVLQAATQTAAGLQKVHLYSEGERQHLIQVPSRVTISQPGQESPPRFVHMQGREVFKFAVQRMVEMIEQAQKEASELGLTIDLLIPHQVNSRIIDSALETTGFPAERVMVNLDRYGNTSAASIPIALTEALQQNRIQPGQTILFVAFGGGLTWGSALLTL